VGEAIYAIDGFPDDQGRFSASSGLFANNVGHSVALNLAQTTPRVAFNVASDKRGRLPSNVYLQ
jgi:hypothetical protein